MPNPLVFLKAEVVQDKLSQITQADLINCFKNSEIRLLNIFQYRTL